MAVVVNIKWGKKKFENVSLNTAGTPLEFKEALYQLTGVPIKRQKIMAKGAWKGVLKDNVDLSACTIKAGQKINLIGTSDGIPKAPEKKTMFFEDMSSKEKAITGSGLPAGLANLQNTCYMNSTLQCLRGIPELTEALRAYKGEYGHDQAKNMTKALKDLFADMGNSSDPVTPARFVQLLRMNFPQPFADRGPNGYKQHDAEELMSTVFTGFLSKELKQAHGMPSLGDEDNLISALFGIKMEERMKCQESEAEVEGVKSNKVLKLAVNIQGGGGSKINIDHLHQGVLLGMEGDVEKMAPTLQRNAIWRKTSRIDRLPRYICVQFMRFYWKATPESRDHQGVKCKIMRPVKFPLKLDTYDFCSERLKAILKVPRDAYAKEQMEAAEKATKEAKAAEEKHQESIKAKRRRKLVGAEAEEVKAEAAEAKAEDAPVMPPVPPAAEEAPTAMEVEGADEADADLAAALAMSMSAGDAAERLDKAGAAGIGLPEGFRGLYEAFACVTHKGRAADGGHYIGWLKQEGKGEDDWMHFDDSHVEPCLTDQIRMLHGGGDNDMAYLLFYRYKE